MDRQRQQLRTEFRQALDDVLPPAPWLEAAVAEDLRKRRSQSSVDGARSLKAVRPSSLVQLAAGLLIVMLGVAAFVELRHLSPQSTPANPPANLAPQGNPVPPSLDGAWQQINDRAAVLILSGNSYSIAGPLGTGMGNVVVNGSEIDFYNGSACYLSPPDGVGRYRWTVSGGLLTFSPLNVDPCSRASWVSDPKGWQRPA